MFDTALGADGAVDLVLAAQDLNREVEIFAVVHGALHLVDDDGLVLLLVDVELGADLRLVGLRADAIDGVEALRPRDVARLQVDRPVADAGHFLRQVETRLLRLDLGDHVVAFHRGLGQGDGGGGIVGELAEQVELLASHVMTRLTLAQGQDTQDDTVADQRDVGVETDLRAVEDGAFQEVAGVGRGVGNHQAFTGDQLALAEAEVVQAGLGRETRGAPDDQLAAFIKLDDGQGRIEQTGRQFADRLANAAEFKVASLTFGHHGGGGSDVFGVLGHGKTFLDDP